MFFIPSHNKLYFGSKVFSFQVISRFFMALKWPTVNCGLIKFNF